MKLDGFGVFVKDMGAMIRFYRDALGFEIREGEDADNVFLVKDGTLFLLYGRRDFEKMTGQKFGYGPGINGHFEIALNGGSVAGVDAAFDRALSLGGTGVLAPSMQPWGQYTSYVADPEGNLVEIGCFPEGGEEA